MTRYIQFFFLLLLTFLSPFSNAQTYPVQVVSTVVSPYSSKLSDYSNAMANRINLQLITTDLLVQNRPAQLHLKIQGNGITAQSAAVLSGIQPIYLNGGEILSLTNADLAGYFRYQNLQGLSTTQYSEALPDGVYTICFQVYDLVTKKWLSQNSCATIYLVLNDPPQLNLPSNYEQIPSSDFPNIIFSWTPRHLNATNVSYDFELKEILNPNLDPAFAFEVSPLLYKEEGIRTTTLLYDINKPTLIPGKRYAWRVKAISTNGLAENSVFKNNGYSQIYSFTYTSNCSAPKYLLSEQQSQSRVKVMWQGESSHQKYHIQYRKTGVENAEWFEVYTVNTQTILQDLEAGFTYEFRVGATCEPAQYSTAQSYVYSGIQTFSIDKDENSTAYNCGIVPNIEVANQQPLGAMVVNETFMAGDFPVKVLEISGANGVFSGSGYIQVPYLFDTRIGVIFDNVRINSDYQLIDGMVETTYDPDWSNVDYVDDLFDVNQQSETVNFPIDTITVNNGEITVTGPNGQTETFPGGKDTVITGSDGKSYYVDANGNVTGPFEQAAGGKPSPENTDGVDKNGEVTTLTAEGVKVTFEKINNETQYAFDQVAYKKALTKEYKEVSGTFVPFKAVPNGKEDKILAKVNITDSNVKADSLFFKTQNGVKIDAKRIGTSDDYTLTLKGAQKFALEEVQATIKQGEKYKIAGVFNLVHVSPKTVKLKLVPTSSTVNVSDKINEIKAIYKQLAIDVDIEVEPSFDINNYLNANGQLPTEDKFGDLSTYSTAQNAIIDAFTKAPDRTIEEAYYLFVTDKEASNGQGGFMRLNNQFGFVFNYEANEKPDEKTKVTATSLAIAHELGHGAFRLEHPFKQYKNKGLSKGNTQGLMDYAKGIELLFTDWQQINDPGFKLYAFQSQSDGELITKVDFVKYLLDNKISEFIYSTQCRFDGLINTRQYGKIEKSDIKVELLKTNDDVARITGRSDIKESSHFLIYKKEGKWILCDRTIDSFLVGESCAYGNENARLNQIYNEFKQCGLGSSDNSDDTLGLSNEKYREIFNNLKAIKENSRSNQGFELHHYDNNLKKNRYFTLDKNSKLIEIDKPLTNEQIENGNWDDKNIDSKVRYTVNGNGIIQISAIGFRSNIEILKGKEVKLKDLGQHIKTQTNKFLVDNNATDYAKSVNFASNEEFADGKKIEIKGKLVKIISEGIGLTTSLLKTGQIEKPTYSDSSTATIKAPGLVTGSFEVIAQKVTDITSLGALVYDVAVDEEVRTGIKTQFKEIKTQIGEDPQKFFPILGEVAVTVLSGNTLDEWKKSVSSPDLGERNHLGTRGIGNTIITAMSGAAFLKDLPEIADKLEDAIKRSVKSLDELAVLFTKKLDDLQLENIKDVFSKLDDVTKKKLLDDLKNFTDADLAQLDDLPELLDEYRNTISKLPDAEKQKKLPEWLERIKTGNRLSENIVNSLKNKGELLKKLADKLEDIEENVLAQYDVLTEVPLETSGGFMRADAVLIKRNALGKIEDVIIIENKLSQTTAFTKRQKEGFGAIINGQTQMKIKYTVPGLKETDNLLNVSKEKIFKIADGGTDDITKVTVEKITKIN